MEKETSKKYEAAVAAFIKETSLKEQWFMMI